MPDLRDDERKAETTEESKVPTGENVAPRLGWLTTNSAPGSLVVDYDGNPFGPLRARATLVLDEASVAHAMATRRAVTLLFENGDPRLPLVIGLLPEQTTLGHLLGGKSVRDTAMHVTLDGRQVRLTADREIVLQCGKASLTLTSDGKIVVRGTYVETEATGTNRLKGGQVKIN